MPQSPLITIRPIVSWWRTKAMVRGQDYAVEVQLEHEGAANWPYDKSSLQFSCVLTGHHGMEVWLDGSPSFNLLKSGKTDRKVRFIVCAPLEYQWGEKDELTLCIVNAGGVICATVSLPVKVEKKK